MAGIQEEKSAILSVSRQTFQNSAGIKMADMTDYAAGIHQSRGLFGAGMELEDIVFISQLTPLMATMFLSLSDCMANVQRSMVGIDRILALFRLPVEEDAGDEFTARQRGKSIETDGLVWFLDLIHRIHPVTQAYGIKIYHYLKLYIDQVISGEKRFSLLPLCVLAEHKQCVRGLWEFIAEKYEIDTADSFLPVYDAACSIKNMGIKYKITEKKEFLYKMKEKIEELENQEPIFVEPILEAICMNEMKIF